MSFLYYFIVSSSTLVSVHYVHRSLSSLHIRIHLRSFIKMPMCKSCPQGFWFNCWRVGSGHQYMYFKSSVDDSSAQLGLRTVSLFWYILNMIWFPTVKKIKAIERGDRKWVKVINIGRHLFWETVTFQFFLGIVLSKTNRFCHGLVVPVLWYFAWYYHCVLIFHLRR